MNKALVAIIVTGVISLATVVFGSPVVGAIGSTVGGTAMAGIADVWYYKNA